MRGTCGFVSDFARGERDLADAANLALEQAAEDHQLGLEHRRLELGLRRDEELDDFRLGGERGGANGLVVGGDIAPGDDPEPFRLAVLLDDGDALISDGLLL